MTQSLTSLFGANATKTGDIVSFDLNDLKDSAGLKFLATPSTATPGQIGAAVIAGMHQNCKAAKDASGNDIVDKTNAIVSGTSFSPKTFEVRQDVSQIKNEFVFDVYTVDSTAFDPDNAV